MPIFTSLRSVWSLLIALLMLAYASPNFAQVVPDAELARKSHYEIDAAQSWLRVLVYRGGLLGGLGHNHVISHNKLSGRAILDADIESSELTMQLSVADFSVDDSAARAIEGDDFPGEISAKDIAGTRKNMLGRKLLDGDNFPTISIRAQSVSGALPDLRVVAQVSLRGREVLLEIPVTVTVSDDALLAMGELSLTHRELGLSPFKAALGALRVRDELVIKYQFHGNTLAPAAEK